MHSVGARACGLWCVAALEGPCAYPNVSAKLPSKGKRVRYLGLARARMTRQACAYAFAHEMHAHSQPPVTPSRLAKKCCISTCAKANGQHVAGSMSALELYLSRHAPLAYTQRICGKSMQVPVRVSMSALCTCARVKGGWLAPIAMFRDADRVLPVLATVCLPRALILRLGRRGWPARNRLLR
jgi:hypothetical protein